MSFDFGIPLRPNESLPPFIILHLIRHGSSIYGADNSLTEAGRLQSVAFKDNFHQHVPFITHIVSSPLLRASETAYNALSDVIERGVEVKIMDQVSGRYDDTLREERGDRSLRNTGVREPTAVEFLKKWLGLRDTDIWDRGSVGEVVIVTHAMLLMDLLGEYSYRAEEFPNVRMRSYAVDRLGNLTFISSSTLKRKRAEYQAWKKSLDKCRVDAENLREDAEIPFFQQHQQPQLSRTPARSDMVLRWSGEQITWKEAMRRDRAMQINTIVHLKPVEREGLKKISRVPGVQWRDAVFSVLRAPDISPPTMVEPENVTKATEQKVTNIDQPNSHKVYLWYSLVVLLLVGCLAFSYICH